MKSGVSSFRGCAYAKVNLALTVARPAEPGGLHPVCSWMHAINLFDEIEIDRLGDGAEPVYELGWKSGDEPDSALSEVEWTIEDDLAVRAHRALEASIGRSLPVRLRVSKRIPAGGGLGGGSSDAASVLVGLNQVFDLGLSRVQLVALGLGLGSDVPFFIDPDRAIPRPAIVEGIGGAITRLDQHHDGLEITLFIPRFGCETGQVYQTFDELVGAMHRLDEGRVRRCGDLKVLDNDALFNDLASPAEVVEPRLGVLRHGLEAELGRPIHVSGSGSTLFVVGSFDSMDRRGVEKLGEIPYRIVSTKLCSG